ncbi:39S ribosomal protein L18, mitochondrial isoform X2 [Cryptotermes secundus]|uniref:39S ribosomal protein L18, mitochondrial isoform X2 n=1 Tax=Cryptotermes secundus TaxID=105785 RepID=UPI000CD7CD5F|nr:39S ribosomal protein L18, mitochondrial isoform X2 [Cryptotermes secundus]
MGPVPKLSKVTIMASITSFMARKAEIPFKTSFLSVASMTTGILRNEACSEFYNRNPRNLERLRIAYKPIGYHLEAPGREFWHKLLLEQSSRHVTAKIVHHSGLEVITASTKEWALKKFLYRLKHLFPVWKKVV